MSRINKQTRGEMTRHISRMRAPRLRTIREFAEQEIIIPDGPHEGRRFRVDRQPVHGLLFDQMDSGLWNRFDVTGCTQSGKTLSASVIPVLYHVFEIGETVIFGLPDMDMAGDKWREDLEPVIARSRYKDLIPTRGGGSRGGKVESIRFKNGATLKFMSGGGSDKSRAGFTARVLIITETDGMDESGGTSREADKITQMEGRTRAYASRRRIYMECTVSVTEGRTWREYMAGSASKIVLCCPHCAAWVSPEREHLTGWQDVENEIEAKDQSKLCCPACGESWTEADRTTANQGARLIHRGQEITTTGEITGPLPQTNTLGFRWSAANNLFVPMGDVAADEWRAGRAEDEENAEKEMTQFVWAVPHKPAMTDLTPVDAKNLRKRQLDTWPRGMVPADTEHLTIGIDIGKWLCHWSAVAWRPGAGSVVVDYGLLPVASDQLGEERAVLTALREFRDVIETGWTIHGAGETFTPEQVWVDSGYVSSVIYEFCRESGERFRPVKGFGATQKSNYKTQYRRPQKSTQAIRFIGDNYHIVWLAKDRVFLVESNVDHWKTWTHRRLMTPLDEPGAMILFKAHPNEHMEFSKQVTAEKQVEEFVAGKGNVIRWERIRAKNHYFDTLCYASAAGSMCGVQLIRPKEAVIAARQTSNNQQQDTNQFTDPDGRAFLITER